MTTRHKLFVLIPLLFSLSTSSFAADPRTPENGYLVNAARLPEMIAIHREHRVMKDETLIEVARVARIGFEAIKNANPDLDVWLPPTDSPVLLPYATLLPGAPEAGIVVNLAEFKLYYLWTENERLRVKYYPVGIGIDGADSPEGRYQVDKKIRDPHWAVPPSIRKERPELGRVVTPGPDNPLGNYWLGLTKKGYGIHGTNEPYGVGRRVSHGCLRMYPEDIEDLFGRVALGTPVRIIYQPIKVGVRKSALFVEAHPDFLQRFDDPAAEARRLIGDLGWQEPLNETALIETISAARGLPYMVGRPSDNSRWTLRSASTAKH
ncbi:MAG: L,D-transpeptidase [Desulfuromonadaceae bacterium]|nr:L,D-transpeptidase [Desulfuromonadaceae bacterium]